MTDVVQLGPEPLRAARELISDREGWTTGQLQDSRDTARRRYCGAGACKAACGPDWGTYLALLEQHAQTLYGRGLIELNDRGLDSGDGHPHVLETYDAAIAMLGRWQQLQPVAAAVEVS